MLPTIQWDRDRVILIDQRRLPAEEVYITCTEPEEVAVAIEQMAIRGAPAIGVAAAFGVALGFVRWDGTGNLEKMFADILRRFRSTRPTARNLFWALERMERTFAEQKHLESSGLKQVMIEEALAIEREDVATNQKIGLWGRELISDRAGILTHCNAGALATAGYGTALGVIRAAVEQGKRVRVFVDETRPVLQGARLTCWELARDGIPAVLITDNMAGFMMQKKRVSVAVTGADRIAANGDTANKIGTYGVAVLAKEHGIPFYVAAPLSTVDFNIRDGTGIPVENRSPEEVRTVRGQLITLPEMDVENPAFDITPARYITAIITEEGVARPPFEKSLARLRGKAR